MKEQNQLEPYQNIFVENILKSLEKRSSILAQLSTGGGKTVVFANIVNDYIKKTHKDVLILVHRMELLNQTRRTLYSWHMVGSEKIDVDNKNIQRSRVYVGMVETLKNRIKDRIVLNLMKNVGLAIIDEAHMSNFKKIFPHFPHSKIIGFTATPIAATKKDPLKNYYNDIVIGCSIGDLITLNQTKNNRGLVRNLTYSISNINRENLKVKGDEFDEEFMASEFSNKKQIQNTIDAYIKYSSGKKAICFNANVAHSKLVTEEMSKAGLNARHLDGGHDDSYRTECFRWLKNTPDAILCNVGIATTGFDEPSIETVIVNSAMKSLSYWLQKCGRGARPYEYSDGMRKEDFLILDLGGNALAHGDWCEERDWENIFRNPYIPMDGKPPVKSCPVCCFINAAASKTCKQCDFEFPIKSAEEDKIQRELVLITTGVNVKRIIEQFKDRGEYNSFGEIIKCIAAIARNCINDNNLEEAELQKWNDIADEKIKEWVVIKGKKNVESYLINAKYKLIRELEAVGFFIKTEMNNIMHSNDQIKIPGFENYLFNSRGEIVKKIPEDEVIYIDGYATITNDDGIEMEFSRKDIEDYITRRNFTKKEYEELEKTFIESYNKGIFPNHIQAQQLINVEKKAWENKLEELEENARLAWDEVRHGKRENALEYVHAARDADDTLGAHKKSQFGNLHSFVLKESEKLIWQIEELTAKRNYLNSILSSLNGDDDFNKTKVSKQKTPLESDRKISSDSKRQKGVTRFAGKLNSRKDDTQNVILLLKAGIESEKAIIREIYGEGFDLGGGKEYSNESGENPLQQIHYIRRKLAEKILGIHLKDLNQSNAYKL